MWNFRCKECGTWIDYDVLPYDLDFECLSCIIKKEYVLDFADIETEELGFIEEGMLYFYE